MAEYVPEDVMVDILSRLPAKSLIRFKTVCKTWYNLVHQPDFTKLHLSRAIHSDERDLLASSPQQFLLYLGYDTSCEEHKLFSSSLTRRVLGRGYLFDI
ncbi:hypothetical protein ACHQM5_003264 [Ranunculus cassubicifolius]